MWIESACHGEGLPLYVLVVAPQNVHASTYVAPFAVHAAWIPPFSSEYIVAALGQPSGAVVGAQ